MRETNLDWIFQGPACAVLVINLIFLFRIMWVSVIKMIERTLKHLLSNYYYNDDVLPKLVFKIIAMVSGPHHKTPFSEYC